jgi:hypothetical protein
MPIISFFIRSSLFVRAGRTPLGKRAASSGYTAICLDAANQSAETSFSPRWAGLSREAELAFEGEYKCLR